MSVTNNPCRVMVDKEGIRTIIRDGRLDTVTIHAELNYIGRATLEKFLKQYVQDKYGVNHFIEWSDKADSLLRHTSALDLNPVLTAPAEQTVTSQAEAMHVKFEDFYWWVEPRDEKAPAHPHDRAAQKRVIAAQYAERERKAELQKPDGGSYFTKDSV